MIIYDRGWRKEPKLRVVIEQGIERVKFPVNMDNGTDSEFIRYFLSIMDQQTNEYNNRDLSLI